MEKKEEEIEFYKRCPTKGCRTISGFSLIESEIKSKIFGENLRFSCPNCQKENELKKWEDSTKSAYDGQTAVRGYDLFYKKQDGKFKKG